MFFEVNWVTKTQPKASICRSSHVAQNIMAHQQVRASKEVDLVATTYFGMG